MKTYCFQCTKRNKGLRCVLVSIAAYQSPVLEPCRQCHDVTLVRLYLVVVMPCVPQPPVCVVIVTSNITVRNLTAPVGHGLLGLTGGHGHRLINNLIVRNVFLFETQNAITDNIWVEIWQNCVVIVQYQEKSENYITLYMWCVVNMHFNDN